MQPILMHVRVSPNLRYRGIMMIEIGVPTLGGGALIQMLTEPNVNDDGIFGADGIFDADGQAVFTCSPPDISIDQVVLSSPSTRIV